jgi:hypothetical protein
MSFEARRQLAVADAALGASAQAIAALEDMLAEYRADDNPLLLGLLHETRAQCALSIGDRAGFEAHLAEVDKRLRSTRNPVLIARISQLKLLAAAHAEPLAYSPPTAAGSELRSFYSFPELNTSPDRYRHALRLVIDSARAKGGCLYLHEGTGLRLAAASALDEPPRILEQELLMRIERARALLHSLDDLDDETKVFDSKPAGALPSTPANDQAPPVKLFSSVPAPRSDEVHRVVVLTARVGGVSKPIGGVILTLDPIVSHDLDPRLLHAVAESLV